MLGGCVARADTRVRAAGAECGRAGSELRGDARLAEELGGAHVPADAPHRPRHLRALRPAQVRALDRHV